MGKRELKKQYKDYDFSVIDMVAKFDPTDTNKLTPFLMNMVEDKLNGPQKTRLRRRGEESHIDKYVKPTNKWESKMAEVVQNLLGGSDNLDILDKFARHQTEGRIEESDINKYNNWTELKKAVAMAELKVLDKELTKQVEIIYQDDTWLFLKPLSLRASQTYGMATQWCTAMKHEPSYFYRYSRDGILVYTINKKTGRKFGFYSSPKEFSVWDVRDKRIDSLETRIPVDLLAIVRESLDLDTHGRNETKFSPEEWKERAKWFGEDKMAVEDEIDMDMEAEVGVGMEMNVTMEAPAPVGAVMGAGGIGDIEREYVDEAAEELIDGNWEARGADVAFGELGVPVNAGMAIEAEVPQEAMENDVMYVTEDEVADAPANVPLEVITEEYGDMDVEARGVGYDMGEGEDIAMDVAG